MPFANVNGTQLNYQWDGPADAPVLLLSNSLGTDLTLWYRQVPALSRSFRILRYDGRGHGLSRVTSGTYCLEMLGRDAVWLLDHLGISKVHFCGISLGGMIGMWIAQREPARVDRLVLANTAAHMGPPSIWEKRISAVRSGGLEGITNLVLDRWLTAPFRQTHPNDVAAVKKILLGTPREGYLATCAAIRDMDRRGQLAAIRAKTLVIAGKHDPATPPAMGRAVADGIAGARYVELPAAHLSNIEAADAFNDAVADFLLA